MSYRSKPYKIQLSSTRQPHHVSAGDFNHLLTKGYIELKSPRLGIPTRGYYGFVENGRLAFASTARIGTFCAAWFWAWLYRVVAEESHGPETWAQKRERLVLERDREAQNEALLWRALRDCKGPNEYAWIPAEIKVEFLRALKPEALL